MRIKQLIIAIMLIAASTSCVEQSQKTQSVDTTSHFVAPDLAIDEIEVKEDHPRYLSRGQAEPDFWDPTYRSNRVLNVYIELDYSLTQAWGVNADLNLQRLCNSSSEILQRIAGPKINLVRVKKWSTPDPYAAITSAGTVLYQWSAANPNKLDTFNVFISGKNFGGIAFISRENVITTKYAVCGFGSASIGDGQNYSYPVYCFTHELLHSLGVSHSQNDCAWLSKSGVRLGRLDSCYSCESTCTPLQSNCNGATKSMNGGLNSYCHLYNRIVYNLHPVVLPVLHKALYYSTLPTYTVTPPQTSNTFSISGVPYTGFTRADTANAIDGNETTRFLTTGATTLTWSFTQPVTRTSLYLSSGFSGGSPNQTLTLTVDGVNIPLAYTPMIKFNKTLNVTGKRFVLTTTGVSNISRIFEISLK